MQAPPGYAHHMRINGLILVSLCFVAFSLRAGPVSLTTNEVLRLRALIISDPAAAAQFAPVRAAADRALGDAPDPVATVIFEGHLEKDPKKIRTTLAFKDRAKIESLGWAWAATGDERYAVQARKILLAWARVNKPDGDAINETQFEPMIVAYDLLRNTFAKADQQIVDAWLRNKAETLWKSTFSVGFGGNWYSHRLKVVGLIGLILDDDSMVGRVTEGFQKQIKAMIKPDGATTEFYVRDSMSYHLYSIEPLLTLACALERHGGTLFDYGDPKGVSLHNSVNFIIPFAERQKTHMEFVNSKSSFDRKRAANGESHYAPHPWTPKSSIRIFTQAAWFVPEYGKLAAKLEGHPDQKFIDWRTVINAAAPR
jgi:hypothetical protein